jgi:hypothetical protein
MLKEMLWMYISPILQMLLKRLSKIVKLKLLLKMQQMRAQEGTKDKNNVHKYSAITKDIYNF